jgi:hypothetical protein
MRLERHDRTARAIALIRRGMRTSIVGHISGLPPATVRALYKEVHGRRPTPGQLPTSSGVLCSPRRQASATLFAVLYRALGGEAIERTVVVDALLKAHVLYVEQLGRLQGEPLGSPIDINQAWIIARDLTIGEARFRCCGSCGIRYLIADFSRTALRCPVCVLKSR